MQIDSIQKKKEIVKRPPVVVVMGHVDHGKTTLLDRIRKTTVAEKEAGGITQSIGAYEITHTQINADKTQMVADKNADQRKSASHLQESAERITFIDTPGHEAFSAMRSRGAKAADIAVLVVAADDGVKPQTKEAIKAILDAKLPYIVALNKIDKVKDLTKVKTELAEQGVLLEGFGGNVSFQAISAKTGEGVPELLDLILLTADVEDLRANPAAAGEGFVLEAKRESRKGVIVTGIVKDGTVRVGDAVATDTAEGKVRQMENYLREPIKEAGPSTPVLLVGFTSLPQVGETFRVGGILAAPKPAALVAVAPLRAAPVKDAATLYVLLKADVSGGLEALEELVKKVPLPANTSLKIVSRGVGEITDGDIQLAIATSATVIGFRTKITKQAATLADAQHVKVVTANVVYDLIKALEAQLLGKNIEEFAGDLEILAVFGEPSGSSQVVGGEVKVGEVKRGASFDVMRGVETIGKGKIMNLQEAKKDVAAVVAGKQCGILVEADTVIKVGDHLIVR